MVCVGVQRRLAVEAGGLRCATRRLYRPHTGHADVLALLNPLRTVLTVIRPTIATVWRLAGIRHEVARPHHRQQFTGANGGLDAWRAFQPPVACALLPLVHHHENRGQDPHHGYTGQWRVVLCLK